MAFDLPGMSDLPALPGFDGDSVNLDLASSAADGADRLPFDSSTEFLKSTDFDVLEQFQGILANSRQFETMQQEIKNDEKKLKTIANGFKDGTGYMS